jgi:hypothetical protein
MRRLSGVGNPARQLFHVELTVTKPVQCEDFTYVSSELLGIEAEPGRRFITQLN